MTLGKLKWCSCVEYTNTPRLKAFESARKLCRFSILFLTGIESVDSIEDYLVRSAEFKMTFGGITRGSNNVKQIDRR